ncbi:MAG: hypothetical protein RJB68_2106 [Pseudomonadota bacterium]|jgi:hypothetical protein
MKFWLLFAGCMALVAALFCGKFIHHGEGPLVSDEEIDRAGLHAMYREILFLVLGLVLGASLFCLFAGYAYATS